MHCIYCGLAVMLHLSGKYHHSTWPRHWDWRSTRECRQQESGTASTAILQSPISSFAWDGSSSFTTNGCCFFIHFKFLLLIVFLGDSLLTPYLYVVQVIPDSLTTLSEFINRMELALSPNGDISGCIFHFCVITNNQLNSLFNSIFL